MTGSPLPFPKFSLIVGGARSGKSRLAERLAHAAGLSRHYIATAEIWDEEMRARIDRHVADRGEGWVTHEAPRDVAGALGRAKGVVLIDCATLWLTNVMLGGGDIQAETAGLLAAIAAHQGPVIVVSNEVGWGIVPDNRLSRDFRDEQGRLNQRLAEAADLVCGVMAGLPLVLKGQLPVLA
ncbi:MAG: bifunctional adenosylcobinamide kinase/adenosylcobinamide-phosphate guanylyltransferase [Pseudorhodobacter sp.]|nr:MAG: bifunctional adenosylcobinamide kinase/adenosylcobinamide-phosphate guanylyltransferase [Pseudorhodobacter sp.]